MTLVGNDGQLTRRRITRADLLAGRSATERAELDVVLEAFAAKRLVVLNNETAEIAHDALLNAWPRLRSWLDDDRSSWILHSQLTEDASAWSSGGRDSSFLYRGTQLGALSQSADKWAAEPGRHPALSDVEHAFLDASSHAAARSARQRRAFAALLVVLLIASITAAGVAVRAAQNANARANAELSGEVAAASEESDISDPDLASLLAAAAWQISPTPQAEESMLDAVAQPSRGTWQGATGVRTAAFSPRGTILATGGLYGQVQLWDVATHRQVGTTMGAGQGVSSVTFSPDGKILATGSSKGVELWDVATHRQVGAPIDVGAGDVAAMAFSPDGKVLAISGADVELWNVARHGRIGAPLATSGGSVAFSPDGRLLAVGSFQGAVQLFTASAGQRVGSPFGANGWETSNLAFSPDGKILATASGDSSARLWDVATHHELGSLQPGKASGSMYQVAFLPGSAIAVTVNEDGDARLWDVATRRQLGPALTTGIGGVISGIAVSPGERSWPR